MAPAAAAAAGGAEGGGVVDSLSHPLNFPPFSVDWVDCARLVVTGGGGASRTGVPNGVWLYLVRACFMWLVWFGFGWGDGLFDPASICCWLEFGPHQCPSLPPPTTTTTTTQVRGGIERLVALRSRSTGDELPHFARAHPSQDLLAVALGRRLELWRLHDLKPMLPAPVVEAPDPAAAAGGGIDPVMVAAFSPCGKYLAAAAHDGRVRLLRLATALEAAAGEHREPRLASLKVLAQCETGAEAAAGKPYRDLAFHPGGQTLLGACEDGSWRAWAIVEEASGQGRQQSQQSSQSMQSMQMMMMMMSPRSPPPLSMPPMSPPPSARPPAPAAAAAAPSIVLQLQPLFALPATTNLLRAHGMGKPGSQQREAAVAAAAGKDQQQGILYTCRCGRFAPDGSAFFTVHYPRRSPKQADKRPYLTRWRVELAPTQASFPPAAGGGGGGAMPSTSSLLLPAIQGLTPTHSAAAGSDPLMCLALHPDGRTGAGGDCSGRTLHFRTQDGKVMATRQGMHNFGVTSLAYSPPTGPDVDNVLPVHPVRLASSSGDKTIRLQYLEPPPHVLAAAKASALAFGGGASASAQRHGRKKKTGGPLRWVLGSLWSLLWCTLLSLLLLVGWYLLCAYLHGVPLERAQDQLWGGVHSAASAAAPYTEVAAPYVDKARALAWPYLGPLWERARPLVIAAWAWVKGCVEEGLQRFWPMWEAHWPVWRAKVEAWAAEFVGDGGGQQGEL